MLSWLLPHAGVNLAASFAVAPSILAGRPRLLLAAVPAPWMLCIVVSFFYLRASMPPSSVVLGPSGHPIILRHGNIDRQLWDEQISTADIAALVLTVVTPLGIVMVGLMHSHHARRTRGHSV